MPSEQDRDRALRRIVEYTEAMGNSIGGEAEGQTDDGRPLSGYNVEHGSHTLVVATVPGWEYFTVLYQWDLPQTIAVQRAVDQHDTSGGGEVEIELDQAAVHAAAEDLAAHVEDEDLQSIRTEFSRTVAEIAPSAAIDIDAQGPLVTGFSIQSKLFPYRDDFDVAAYAETVQTTVTAGWIAREFLVDAYDLDELSNGDIAPTGGDGGPPSGSSDGTFSPTSDDDPAMFQ